MDESTLLNALKDISIKTPQSLHNNVLVRIRSFRRERIIRNFSAVVIILFVAFGLLLKNPPSSNLAVLNGDGMALSGDLRMNDMPWGNERVDLIYMGGSNDN